MHLTMDTPLVSGAPHGTELSRRALLGCAVAGSLALAVPFPAMAAGDEWRLAIRNVHNGESVDAVFARAGQFVPAGISELNHGLRDWRTGEAIDMDPRLLALLVRLRDTLEVRGNRKLDLISGYRSPKTNASLRAMGGAHTGVASQSQHMLGMASDIMIQGVPLDRLHGAALALGGGGVGYYPRDGFVHVDTGRVRSW